MEGPNPLAAAWSLLQARRVAPPRPTGPEDLDASHEALDPILTRLATDGIGALAGLGPALAGYRRHLAASDPDALGRRGALAFWLNLYNAAALELAAEADRLGTGTVLRVPGAFTRRVVTVAGEPLSLDGIEHGKVRRFGDPRIHAALVCGALSCPTLRYEPFTAAALHDQLDDQMRSFLAGGGARRRGERLELSRVFLWYGGDFTRPHAMPTYLPASHRNLRRALLGWLPPELAAWTGRSRPRVAFQPYDYGLACAVG